MLSQRVILVLSGQFVTTAGRSSRTPCSTPARPPASGSEKSFPSPWATPSRLPDLIKPLTRQPHATSSIACC
uniref:Secreted protein n=1 Tax=Macrostomum lignano TaxID=282301 RepID=A0A1I8IXF7_9PLAT